MKFIKTIFESLSEYSTITANIFPLLSIKEKATFVTYCIERNTLFFTFYDKDLGNFKDSPTHSIFKRTGDG